MLYIFIYLFIYNFKCVIGINFSYRLVKDQVTLYFQMDLTSTILLCPYLHLMVCPLNPSLPADFVFASH